VNTGIAIPPQYWCSKELMVKDLLPTQYGSPEKLNEELIRLKRIAEDLVYQSKKQQIQVSALALGDVDIKIKTDQYHQKDKNELIV
jgi:hypothetical protein